MDLQLLGQLLQEGLCWDGDSCADSDLVALFFVFILRIGVLTVFFLLCGRSSFVETSKTLSQDGHIV